MLNLEIPFTSDVPVDFEIKINESQVDYTILNNKIVVNVDLNFGFYLLSVKCLQQAKVKFSNIFVNQTNIRQFLYLSWTEENNSKIQPCTELWSTEQIWYAPISLPLSLLISSADEKFDAADLGTNLYEKYKIFYPESIDVHDSYPQLVKDFFKHNFDFHVYRKQLEQDLFANEQVPYFHFNYFYDEKKLYNELVSNQEYLFSKEKIPAQHKYNQADYSKYNQEVIWRTVFTYPYKDGAPQTIEEFALDKNLLPELYRFYSQLPIKNVYLSFLGFLPAGGYISPHKDFTDAGVPKGCSQLYFALNAKPGNFLKINNVGLVPFQDQPTILNNQSFTHALINQSNEPRWVISVLGDINDTFIKELKHA